MKPTICISVIAVLILFACSQPVNKNKYSVSGVKEPIISLNGKWKFSLSPPESFREPGIIQGEWSDIQVPGECQMQGFAIKHDQPYVYKHQFLIPEDFNGKQMMINFYGVYSYARVWVNGHFIREHYGGFTKWDCDITSYVKAGENADLTLEIVDRSDDISYGSGYAKHQIGGILRNVELVALPEQNFKQLYFETGMDENYENADLKVFYELNQNSPAAIKLELYDADDNLVVKSEKELLEQKSHFSIPVKNPDKWDAEHPNLYNLVTTLLVNGTEIQKIPDKIGFRKVEIEGNKMLINGQPVKLRGACRHDIYPLLGRMTTPEYDKKDVLLAKEANINFIRTSHYPPSEAFLDYCDQYGIYVEAESAVCFVGSHRTEAYKEKGASQNDPEFTHRYLSQLEEMIQHHRNHPGVIIWSIGNENVFGINFMESFKLVKEKDSTRPVIYSYPGQVPDSVHIYEILSMHYPDWQGNLDQYGISTRGFDYLKMPVLFDEWAHVACYNNYELKYDPNVRNFWGQSLDSMWTNLFEADGGLGGAIWCMLDETFMLPEDLPGYNKWWGILDPDVIPPAFAGSCVGYGEWGILDVWRRKKPEFWETKKAYSPTKVLLKQINDFQYNKDLVIPVYNRFDHTNFNELKIAWRFENKFGELKKVHIKPHEKGVLVIPGQKWKTGEKVNLWFYQNDTLLIDEYNIQLGNKAGELPLCRTGKLNVEETEKQITVSGINYTLNLIRKTGLLENVIVNNDTLIKSGPYINLNLPGDRFQFSTIRMQNYAENWKCTDLNCGFEDGIATINTKGTYDSISADFIILMDENGIFNFDYRIENVPAGKYIQELGIDFITGNAFKTLSWERNSYFTSYPESHLGNQDGKAELAEKPEMHYREYPAHDWESDTRSFYYLGLNEEFPYTNIARALKENIYSFALTAGNSKLEVISNGNQACRFDRINGGNTLIINDLWDYTSLLWGNYMKHIESTAAFHGQICLSIESLAK